MTNFLGFWAAHRETLPVLAVTPPPPPDPGPLPALWTCLFCIREFYIGGIVQCVVFYNWLSLSGVFLRFIHAAALYFCCPVGLP